MNSTPLSPFVQPQPVASSRRPKLVLGLRLWTVALALVALVLPSGASAAERFKKLDPELNRRAAVAANNGSKNFPTLSG